MADDTVTYYPGDTVTLKIRIKHLVNFVNMEAVLRGGNPDRDDTGSLLASLSAGPPRVQDVDPDGKKSSEVVFEAEATRSKFVPGLVYDLEQINGQTVEGKTVVLGINDLQELNEELRFRYAAEPANGTATVRDARLE